MISEVKKLDVKPEQIIIRKWHEGNNRYEECTLRELWENGFHNGQSFQEHNKHLITDQILDTNNFHVNASFFDDRWKSFWADLKDAEILIKVES